MTTVVLEIDGARVEAAEGTTILEAALDAGIYIPHLCSHPDLPPVGACGMCVVEVTGDNPGAPRWEAASSGGPSTIGEITTGGGSAAAASPVPSCTARVADGMTVSTKTTRVKELRRTAMELILSRHPPECTTCDKYLNCELQSIKQFVGITEELRVRKHPQPIPADTGNPLFVRDMGRCILCGRCVRACNEFRGIGALALTRRGRHTRAYTGFDRSLAEAGCRFCGACVQVCPTGALRDRDELTRGKSRRAALVPCTYSCPVEIDVPRYVRLAQEGDYPAAAAVVREKAPFPLTLGYVCGHPCEEACRRGHVNEPIAIRELKRLAALNDDGSWKTRRRQEAGTGKRVGIVGSGPAGLTAAYYLRGRGHEVTVFEALPEAGGMLRVGIPSYRLPRDVLDAEIREIEDLGVEIRRRTPVESLDALIDEGYEAVVVAVGAHVAQRLPIPGAELEGAFAGVDFLRDVNSGAKVHVGKTVAVVGGGNVAMDCARVARRLGAAEVSVICLECREDMPASVDEVEEGEEEGVTICDSRTLTGIGDSGGRAGSVECRLVDSFEFDDEGGLEIDEVFGSDHALTAETIILAIGQRPDLPESWCLDVTPRGTVELDPYTFETSREGIFAAGDAVTGTISVVKAIASGRQAAIAVDRYLGGTGDIDERLARPTEAHTRFGPSAGFANLGRRVTPRADPEQRVGGFDPVVEELAPDSGKAEAERCLRCDLRLEITQVKFWGDY